MTCETYRALLVDDERNTEPRLEHAAACETCAEFTREQQHVLSILARIREEDALGESNEIDNRNVRVENNLLAAFREFRESERPEALRSPEPATLPMLPQLSQESSGTSFRKWGALAAAVILGSGVLLWISQTPQVPSLPNPPRVSHLTQLPRDWSVLSARNGGENRAVREVGRKSGTAGTASSARTLSVDELASAATSAAVEVSSASPISPTRRQNLNAQVAVALDTDPSNDEPFMQLVPGTPGFLDDGPVVMRVRMPYAAAEYLGVAAGMTSPGQPLRSGFVQADLLVGSDGTTRGIRFVQ